MSFTNLCRRCCIFVIGGEFDPPGLDAARSKWSGFEIKEVLHLSFGAVCGRREGFRCAAGEGGGKVSTRCRNGRGAGVAMQRLAMATHRRIAVDSKTGRPCLVCKYSSGSSGSRGAAAGGEGFDKEPEQSPPQDAVLKAISEVSKAEGRVGKTTNIVIGGTVKENADSEWNVIDQKVNVYPMVREFTAIGMGGDEFVQAMVEAVESIVDSPVPEGGVTKKLSAQGKYVSVKIGGVTVSSSEQVRAVYDAMRKDARMKYFL